MVIAVTIVVSAGTALAQVRPDPVPIELVAFVDELNRHAATIEQAEPQQVTRILVQMPHAYRVRHGEQAFDVPFERVEQRLLAASKLGGGWPSARHELLEDLRGIRDEAAGLLGTGPSRIAETRSALTEILSRPEFLRSRSPDWRAGIRRRLTEWVQALWERLGGDRVNSRAVGVFVAWTAALAAAIALAVWLSRRTRAASPRRGLHIGELPRVSWHEWSMRAVEAVRNGRGREAARCSYRAALSRLEEEGRWRVEDSRTAREYLKLMRPADPHRDVFTALARQFESAWYASRQVTTDDQQRLIDSLERLGCLRPHERAI
jgi:hypothetical protein